MDKIIRRNSKHLKYSKNIVTVGSGEENISEKTKEY